MLCDGQELCSLKENVPTSANVAEGTHLFTFIHSKNKKAIVERQVKCTTKDNNIICITGLAAANKLHPSIFVKILNKIRVPQVKNKQNTIQLINKISSLSLMVAAVLFVLGIILEMCNNPQSQEPSDDSSVTIENKKSEQNVQDENTSSPKTNEKSEVVEQQSSSTVYSEDECSVRIESMKLEHNVQDEDGNYGMRIVVEASASNLKGEIVHLLIRFYDKDGTPLKYTGTDEKYLAVDGTMSLQSKFGVTGESVHLNCSVIVPYNEFNVTKSGTTHFLVDACYYLQQGDDFSLLAKSNVCAFHLTL